MTRTGADWSGAFPGVTALQAQGMTFAGRYLAYDHPRGMQAFELAAMELAGMDVISYYEEQETSILAGASFGVRAGQNALALWRGLGIPDARPLFLACDTDITASQIGPVYAALDGLASVIGRQNAGIYGGVVPVHLARVYGHATYAVQAGAWRYRAAEVGVTDPYGWSPYAQARQDGYNLYIGGTQCDHLTALAGDFGQWRRPAPQVDVPPITSPMDPNEFSKRPTLKYGDVNASVCTVKFILNYAYHTTKFNVMDGHFDHDTYQGVVFWQGLSNLKQDGIVGPSTWASFGKYVSRVHRYDLEPVLKFNDNTHPGNVKTLQATLNAVIVPGFTPLVVDGGYGPRVRDCVAQYERNRHLTVDGVVGRQVWADLGVLMTARGK